MDGSGSIAPNHGLYIADVMRDIQCVLGVRRVQSISTSPSRPPIRAYRNESCRCSNPRFGVYIHSLDYMVLARYYHLCGIRRQGTMVIMLLLFLAHVCLVSGRLAERSTAASYVSEAPPTVTLDYATYEGVRNGTGVDVYYSIRYAAPPLGDLRFRAPQDPEQETEVQKATTVSMMRSHIRDEVEKGFILTRVVMHLVRTNMCRRRSGYNRSPGRRLSLRERFHALQRYF